MTDAEIVRRDDDRQLPEPAARLTLFGAGVSPESILVQVDELARVLTYAIRTRGLSQQYGGNVFVVYEGWALLAGMIGCSARIVSTAPLADGQGWQATAECVSTEGRVLGSAVALARREEPGKGSMSDHALTATAQTRARRNALRSVLGWIPRIGGLDVADPGAPVTREQVRALWAVSHERGWDRARVHELAGVESLNALTREQAGELLESWRGPDEPPPEDQPSPVAAAADKHPPHRWIEVEGRPFDRCEVCGETRRRDE